MNKAALAVSVIATALMATGCSSGGNSILAANGASKSASVTSFAAKGGAVATSPAAKTSSAHSSSAPAAKGGSSVNVCALLSASQASTLNNVPYSGSTPQHVQAGYDTCTYKNAGSAPDPVNIQDLTVTVISIAGCWSGLESAEGPGTPVSGVGDAAFGYSVGIDVKIGGDHCVDVSGLTHAELNNDYGPDTAMAKIVVSALR